MRSKSVWLYVIGVMTNKAWPIKQKRTNHNIRPLLSGNRICPRSLPELFSHLNLNSTHAASCIINASCVRFPDMATKMLRSVFMMRVCFSALQKRQRGAHKYKKVAICRLLSLIMRAFLLKTQTYLWVMTSTSHLIVVVFFDDIILQLPTLH